MTFKLSDKIGVGIIGVNPERGWARVSHLPAIKSLPNYELRAVSTTRRASAERSARAFAVDLAFDNHHNLLARPEVDLAVIAVNVTHHHEIAAAAIDAGKMVYCEWPLGRNLAEAEDLAFRARRKGVRAIIGLQGRFAPAVRYLRDLVSDGYVGKVLGTSIKGSGPDDLWAGILAPEFEITADPSNGNTLLAIPVGHALDMLAFALGEFACVSSTLIARRGEALRLRDNAIIPMGMHDQIALSGALETGALASVHYHGGPSMGPDFVWEINGTDGDLILSAERGYANMSELKIEGARSKEALEVLGVADEYRLAPPALDGPPVNVASLYTQLALDLAKGTSLAPDFDVAVRRHKLLDAIERANTTGVRQMLPVESVHPGAV